MSNIILQTMITNKLNQDRTVRWAEKSALHLPGNKSVIVDGAYPTACKTPRNAKQLEEEVRQGWIELTIITNLPTAEPVGGPGAVPNPEAIKAADADKKAKKEVDIPAQPLDKYKNSSDERFVQKEDAEGTLAPKTLQLPGTEDQVIPEPVTKEMFPEGATLEQEGQRTAVDKVEPVKEEAKEEAPKKAPAKKTTAKKTTTRKKSTTTKKAAEDKPEA